jgi:RNA-directed DNA polymerase
MAHAGLSDFLGYEFRPRAVWGTQSKRVFCGFTPAVSPSALKTMRSKIRELNIRGRTQVSLADVAQELNPIVRGWLGYYGRYRPSASC